MTMGCGDTCPIYPGKRYLDWDLPDPAGKSVDEIIEERIEWMKRTVQMQRSQQLERVKKEEERSERLAACAGRLGTWCPAY